MDDADRVPRSGPAQVLTDAAGPAGASVATSTDATAATAGARSRLVAGLNALRVHQWSKNLLLFVPAILDHRLLDGPVMLRALLAFAAFCCAVSGGYVLNDLLDLKADRWHPVRRRRPFAAGALSRSAGLAVSAVLFALALMIAVGTLPPRFLDVLLLYVGLTTAYSLRLKRVLLLDVILLAGFYTLRVLGGLAATGVRFSTWLPAHRRRMHDDPIVATLRDPASYATGLAVAAILLGAA